jgi:CRISPR-associated protein Csm3
MSNAEELQAREVGVTEIKFENTIDRGTAVANPRQIERVVRGGKFDFDLIYDVDCPEELIEDFSTLRRGLTLIEQDYLGGHGSRGSGRVLFQKLEAKVVYGKVDGAILDECTKALSETA